MTFLYVFGNLVGRALVSYALVWVVCWLASRFSWRTAFRRTARWYSIAAIVVLTLGGFGAAVVRQGGVN